MFSHFVVNCELHAVLLQLLPLQVSCMLEVLRGAATATQPNSFNALLSMFSSLLGPLLTLHSAFKHQPPVVALLLKLADDVVENMTTYIEDVQQKEQLLNWMLQLLAQYRDSNLWQVITGRPAAGLGGREGRGGPDRGRGAIRVCVVVVVVIFGISQHCWGCVVQGSCHARCRAR